MIPLIAEVPLCDLVLRVVAQPIEDGAPTLLADVVSAKIDLRQAVGWGGADANNGVNDRFDALGSVAAMPVPGTPVDSAQLVAR